MEQRPPRFRGLIWIIVMIGLIVAGVYLWNRSNSSDYNDYSMAQFKEDVAAGNVNAVEINQNAEVPTGKILVGMMDGTVEYFHVSDVNEVSAYIDEYNAGLKKGMESVEYTVKDIPRRSAFVSILPYILISVLLMVFMFMMLGSLQGMSGGSKMMDFGKSRAKVMIERDHDIDFTKVAGLKEEKQELEEIVDFLKNPEKYIQLGARIPKGVLLVGSPGTGKTLLAKAVSGEAGVPFLSISGSDFVEMFVGVGASRVRDLFAEAKNNSPCIIFIDEIDAVGRKRGSGLGGGHDEREQTLNQLLVEMDGFGVNEGIIVMAATNRVDILDPALLRPGRFDRKVVVGHPDVKGRKEILDVHTANKRLGDDVNLEELARTTTGFVGADLENLMNESAIIAATKDHPYICKEDVDQAFIKVGVGTEKRSRMIPEKTRMITAYHEAGHAILFHLLPDVGPVYAVSIIPTGEGAAGYTMRLPKNDNEFTTKGMMRQDIMVDFGGRIAEEIIFDDVTTGASQDIKVATQTARAMVMKYGFSEKLGMINYESSDEEEVFLGRDLGHAKSFSEKTQIQIDKEVRAIVSDCYAEARSIIEENMDVLHACAKLLLVMDRIDGSVFESLFTPEGYEKAMEIIAEAEAKKDTEEAVAETIEETIEEVVEETVEEAPVTE